MQMVFQNPDGTLNPSHPVGWPLARALRKFGIATAALRVAAHVRACWRWCGCRRACGTALPRQLSGGQKQRIAIARAFAGNPELLVADEPVSALDVSVQAAVINLLLGIQAEQGTTMVFISHDLVLVRYLADEVVVMYLGRVMECGPVRALFEPPYHPYTEALLSAVPLPDPAMRRASASGWRAKSQPARPAARLPLRRPLPAQAWAGVRRRSAAGAGGRGRAPDLLPHPAGGIAPG